MPESGAMLGYGSVFQMQTEDSPDVFQTFDEVTNITPPSEAIDQIDVTHMQSPDRRREFISGLIDGGEASFDMNYIPGNATDDRLMALLALGVGISRRRICRISFPNGVTVTFTAELTGYEKTIPFDDKMTATVTLKVTGAVTLGST